MRSNRYESRLEAGKILAEFIKNNDKELYHYISQDPKKFFCYAIPNGGIPVAEGFCSLFNINYDILIVRKIKIPYNTEAGFGAVTPNGTILFNHALLNRLNLSEKQIKTSIEITKKEISQRINFYKQNINLEVKYEENINKRKVFLIDDGLASGFTMLAAISMVKKYSPDKVWVAIPTAPLNTVKKVQNKVDYIFCPKIRDVVWFAVADAYNNWYDVPDSEVLEIIQNSNFFLEKIKK